MNKKEHLNLKKDGQVPDLRERYLAALVEIQTLLLSEEFGEMSLKSILNILGKAAGASRVYVHTNSHTEDGRWFNNRLAFWEAPALAPASNELAPSDFAYDENFPHWFGILSRGMYINEIEADFPEPEINYLKSLNIQAVLVLPIFISGTFYGFIGFDNCQEARKWTPSEIALLQIAAAGISLAQQRQWDEETLRRSQSSLLLVLDQLPAFLWTTNRNLNITSIRGSGRLGLSTEELSHFFSLFQTRTENPDMVELHRQALDGQQVSFEILREDQVFQARLEPFYNSASQIVGVLGLALDISERKRVEADLRKSEEALRSLNAITLDAQLNFVEKINALLVTGAQQYDLETGILFKFSDANCQMIEQYSALPMSGAAKIIENLDLATCRDVFKSETQVAFERITGSAWENHPFFKNSAIESFLGTPIRVAGKLFGALTFLSRHARRQPFSLTEKEFLNLMAQWVTAELEREQYLTQLKDFADENARSSAALAVARDQALEASRLKSEFLATMSHEIRTPMNALMGMTELLQDSPLNREQREYADVIKNSAQDLLALINDILDLSKIEAGKLSLEAIEFEPLSVVENTAELFAARASLKKISFMVYVSPAIPAVLKGDPVRLRQVLANLVSNAIKFTDQGEVIVRVEPCQEIDGQIHLRFEVQDSGIGLSEIARRRLFQPFTQADGSTSRKYGGTGLGLAISRRLVDLLGGKIGVESVEGLGSTFWFSVPFMKIDSSPAAGQAKSVLDLAGVHVLLADGSSFRREIIRRYCTFWGMRCSEAKSFEEAVTRIRSSAQLDDAFQIGIFDGVILTASRSSFDDTIALFAGLKLKNFIILTSFDQRRHEEQTGAAGNIIHISQPVKRSLLYEKCFEEIYGPILSPAEVNPPAAVTGFSKEAGSTGSPQLVNEKTQGIIILLAEDNPANQKLTTAQLKKLGYCYELTADGREAVKAVLHQPEHYALVLMDTQMPEMDGMEAARIIRQAEAFSQGHVPIVGLTASSLQEDLDACISAGMDCAISKPINLELLRSTIERWRKPEESAIKPGNQSFVSEADAPLDASIIAEIRSLQGEDVPNLLAELIESYLINSRLLIERIHHSIDASDLLDLKKAVHSLKGSSGNLGAMKLGEMCSEMQGFVEAGNIVEVRSRLPEMLAEHERVVTALQAELKTPN